MTYEDIKKASGIYDIPKTVHVNNGVVFDVFLLKTLMYPNYEEDRDYHYDFDVFLPKYGINLQRPYVWEHCQQNEFILSILWKKPIDPIVAVQHVIGRGRENVTMYIIDGKQRLMTIQKFVHNEFPIIVEGKEVYYRDFDHDLKCFFRSRVDGLTGIIYYSYEDAPVDDDMKIKLFNYYNFSGTPQTEEHKNKLQSLLK